jgi:uncharacterized protein
VKTIYLEGLPEINPGLLPKVWLRFNVDWRACISLKRFTETFQRATETKVQLKVQLRERMTAKEVIEKLGLKPLPDEGGYYRETYRENLPSLPARSYGIDSQGSRLVFSAIYYLLVPESFSALHRLKSDEVFHFYAGDPVEMIHIDDQGQLQRWTLGNDISKGHVPQLMVPRGTWQGTRLSAGGQWALLGTTTVPGFELADFELGDRNSLLKLFPQLQDDIIRFTRGQNEKTH